MVTMVMFGLDHVITDYINASYASCIMMSIVKQHEQNVTSQINNW